MMRQQENVFITSNGLITCTQSPTANESSAGPGNGTEGNTTQRMQTDRNASLRRAQDLEVSTGPRGLMAARTMASGGHMQYLTESDLVGERGCVLSDCGSYRYRLWSDWNNALPTLAFVMLNPSTADHLTDDPTITRCLPRAIADGFGRIAMRATGALELIRKCGMRKELFALGLNKDGIPTPPLYVVVSTRPRPFTPDN